MNKKLYLNNKSILDGYDQIAIKYFRLFSNKYIIDNQLFTNFNKVFLSAIVRIAELALQIMSRPIKSKTIMKSQTKKVALIFSLIFITTGLIAATITVDNKVNSGAMYTSLSDAIAAAESGDTILVAGSPTNYGSITINKELILIGNGYAVDNPIDNPTQITGLTFDDDGHLDDPSNSYISGFRVTSNTTFNFGMDILMERCYVANVYFDNGNVSGTIRNSIMNILYIYGDVSNPVNIQNSIITGGVLSNRDPSPLLMDHCLFLNSALEYSTGLSHAMINNSIFFGINVSGCDDVDFNNNLAYIDGSTVDFQVSGSGPNNGGPNQENVDPMFVDVTSNSFSFNFDYRLQSGSPAEGYGDDGSDIGIYGGAYAFPIGGTGSYLLRPQPNIPYITEMNIENGSVPENGTLNVNIKATKKD